MLYFKKGVGIHYAMTSCNNINIKYDLLSGDGIFFDSKIYNNHKDKMNLKTTESL